MAAAGPNSAVPHRVDAPVVRVVIVDDHDLLRAGVRDLMAAAPGFEVVGEAADGHAALRVVQAAQPDVVLLDIAMPVLDGVAATALLRALDPAPAVVLFTAWADHDRVAAGMAAGASSFVLKDSAPDVMLAALTEAAAANDDRPSPPVADGDGAGERDRQRRLVDRACEGDADAWEELYRSLYPRLLAFARRRLPVSDARDAVAETFLRALGSLQHVRWRRGGFDAWVFGIARHVVADTYRAAARRSEAATRSSAAGHIAVAATEPLEAVLDGEEAAAVRRAFLQLSDADRELLELRVVAGLSFEETAAVLGRRPASLRMAQTRALARLRACLEQQAGAA